VRGVERHRHRANPNIETAYRATVFVRHQNALAKTGIALAPYRCGFQIETDRSQDVLMKGVREMSVQQTLRDLCRECRVGPECGDHVRSKPASCVVDE
jgi:hypothetical protein